MLNTLTVKCQAVNLILATINMQMFYSYAPLKLNNIMFGSPGAIKLKSL